MKSTSALLALALPLSFSAAFAATAISPKDIKLKPQIEKTFVTVDAKGDLSHMGAALATIPEHWFNLSPAQGIEGVRTEETYEKFGLPVSEDIIVAVVDSGVDVNHEDLQGKIWINKGEIANNGIDDDQNGYVDDVFGWNFIGHEKGMATIAEDSSLANGIRLIKGNPDYQIAEDTLEVTREVLRMRALKETLERSGEELTPAQAAHLEKVEALVKAARASSRSEVELQYYYNTEFDPRKDRVGDNYLDQNERIYGNNDVIGPDSSHGTHVAGSIAALRNNGIGMNGIATNVKIMAVRVVPNGDERDKDVANGIRYAVDNGARIINMSFGKAFSPYKKVVDEAFAYAESKGGLVLHAAGNDSKNNDVLPSYPSRFHKKEGREFKNWIEVCATAHEKGLGLPATFTNYGKKTVDLCAPGVKIYSTTPNNTYGVKSGTSMATPTVAGVAALTLSYAPDLSGEDLKAVLIDTARRYPKLKVNLPKSRADAAKPDKQVLFSTLSTYGSIVDVFEAVSSLK